jgi:hypothetical protein
VAPPEIALGESAQLTVYAVKSNGSRDDVTKDAFFRTSSTVLNVTQAGLATGAEAGEGSVTVRFETFQATATIRVQSSVGSLQVTTMGISDVGQGALGDWQYNATLYVHENGGIDVTVTNIQVQVLVGPKVLATASITPMLSVSAHSKGDTAFVFSSDSHVQVSEMTVNVTVDYRDAKGNTGSVSSSFECFGCYDY